MGNVKLDEIGYWSEVKLDIIKEYAKAYSIIMNAQRNIQKYLYIDGFAGAGEHISKRTKEYLPGSPLNAFWGDDSWRNVAYTKTKGLFYDFKEKTSIEPVVKAYQDRLKKVASFAYVPDPIPMRNSMGAIVYYLFFASPKKTGAKIVKDIFDKYKNRGVI